MSGGFFYNRYDNKYMKSLNTIDFIFDIINLIPNQILSTNNKIKDFLKNLSIWTIITLVIIVIIYVISG